ncbi:MAG: cytochrome d ubiquinol oxidase subunit II [Acidobacteriaceae bacterium]
MGTIWFWLTAIMLVFYVVLDGFDIGVGAIHMIAGRTSAEREQGIRAIGPVWDGNEVWLLAGGGTLFFAFPALYAAGFSGFYLPLMIVLWLLVLRGVSVELRMHIGLNVWQDFFDGVFNLSSALLAVFLGAALANVIRGVPLGADGYFFAPLWTNWRMGPYPGILDWYTVIGGVLALVALSVHGAFYLAMKTEGEVQRRARKTASVLLPLLVLLTVVGLLATMHVQPLVLQNYMHYKVAMLVPVAVLVALMMMFVYASCKKDAQAFLSSSTFLAVMLAGAVIGLYPVLLPSTLGPQYNITIENSLSGHHGLVVGLVWWGIGMVMASVYFTIVYRMFRGKVQGTA